MRACLLALLVACACAADPWDRLADASRKPDAEARSALEQLVLENPAFHAARFNLGTLLLGSDPAKAAEQLELATAATSTSLAADAWHNLALARFAQGRLEDALRAAEQAATRDPAAVALRDEIRRVVLVRQDEARRKAEEEAKKLHLAPQPLPVGRVGERYEAQLPIRGGTPPATATLAGDSKLPAGLSLSRDGMLSGTPHAAGDTRLELALADNAQASVNAHVDLRILPAPAITTATLPEAVIRQTYTVRLEAVGLDAPLRWSVANLPEGLTASADGTISGSTTVTGTRTLHVHVEDGTRQANRMLELTVTDLFAPAEDPLPPATAGAAYRHRGTVRGPAQEYRWAAGADAPLSVSADGTISGTPAQPGDLSLPLRLSAADGRTREMAIHLPVNPRPLIQTEPVQVTVGTPLDRPLSVAGGTAPFAWSVASGALPAGLRLDADGHLRGVAKDPGTSTVTVAVEDHWKAATQAEIQITSAPSSNPPPDQDKDKQDQAKDDKQQQGKDDKQQQGKDDKQQQGTNDKQQQGKDDKQQQGTDGQQPGDQDKQQEQQQAAMLNQTAADRWLDQLPDEDRDVLRYQLLDGGQVKPAQPKGPQW